jgi:hypothetical protein
MSGLFDAECWKVWNALVVGDPEPRRGDVNSLGREPQVV